MLLYRYRLSVGANLVIFGHLSTLISDGNRMKTWQTKVRHGKGEACNGLTPSGRSIFRTKLLYLLSVTQIISCQLNSTIEKEIGRQILLPGNLLIVWKENISSHELTADQYFWRHSERNTPSPCGIRQFSYRQTNLTPALWSLDKDV